MKFNFKTLKKAVLSKNLVEIIIQLEGFEAELREKLSQPEYSDLYKTFTAQDVIEEILGE